MKAVGIGQVQQRRVPLSNNQTMIALWYSYRPHLQLAQPGKSQWKRDWQSTYNAGVPLACTVTPSCAPSAPYPSIPVRASCGVQSTFIRPTAMALTSACGARSVQALRHKVRHPPSHFRTAPLYVVPAYLGAMTPFVPA